MRCHRPKRKATPAEDSAMESADSNGMSSGNPSTAWVMLDESDPLVHMLEDARLAKNGEGGGVQERRRMLTKNVLDENDRALEFHIMPDSQIKALWDLLVVCTLAFVCIMSPMLGAFAPELDLSRGWRICGSLLAALVLFVLVADIGVSMRTAFMDDGVYIRLPRLIASHYFRTRAFFLDVLAAVPLRLLLAGSTWRGLEHDQSKDSGPMVSNGLFEFVCLWDLFKLNKLMRKLDSLDHWANFHSAVTQLVKLFLGLAYMWFWTGMMYFYIGTVEDARAAAEGELVPSSFSPQNWFEPGAPVAHKIVRSVFWGISITSGIGPDIEPESFNEVLFTSVCSLLSILVYALTIGSASAAIADLQAPLQARRRRLEQLNEYMRYKNVPLQLRQRVNAFFDYRGLSLLGVVSDSDVMHKMPISLNAQLSVSLNRSLFSQVPLFRECPATLLLAMVSRLVPLIHMPGDWIIREGTEGKALYFINRGQCVVIRAAHKPPSAAEAGVHGPTDGLLERSRTILSRLGGGSSPHGLLSRASTSYSKGRARGNARTDANTRANSRPAGRLPPVERKGDAPGSRGHVLAQPVETVAVLSDNDFFGERALMTAGLTAASVQAITYCDLMALYQSEFAAVVRDFPFFAAVIDQHAGKQISGRKSIVEPSGTGAKIEATTGELDLSARHRSRALSPPRNPRPRGEEDGQRSPLRPPAVSFAQSTAAPSSSSETRFHASTGAPPSPSQKSRRRTAPQQRGADDGDV